MIAIITDSNAMLPRWLRDRHNIRVIPLGLVLNGQALQEDDDLDVSTVLRAMQDGATLTTSAPSPGEIARAFVDAMSAGADSIMAVHIGSEYSSTVGSARVAATMVDIPVEVVDSHHASFSLGCCVWAAAEQLDGGGSLVDALNAVSTTSATIASVFTIAEMPRARSGGRFPAGFSTPTNGTPIMALDERGLRELGWANSLAGAVEAVVAYVADRPGSQLRVGVGDADDEIAGAQLADRLDDLVNVSQVVRYRCGPSVAAHTGVGTFGAVLHPLLSLA